MCMVSMVLDYGHRTPAEDYTLDRYHDLWRMIEQAKKFDEKQGEKDCEDPAKVEFLKEIIERLKGIENRLTDIEAKQELDRVNSLLGPVPPSSPIFLDPYIGGIGIGSGVGIVAGQPYIVTTQLPLDENPTPTVVGETHDEAWARKSSGYCPKCGGQWVEAPCADPEHRRRRYAF